MDVLLRGWPRTPASIIKVYTKSSDPTPVETSPVDRKSPLQHRGMGNPYRQTRTPKDPNSASSASSSSAVPFPRGCDRRQPIRTNEVGRPSEQKEGDPPGANELGLLRGMQKKEEEVCNGSGGALHLDAVNGYRLAARCRRQRAKALAAITHSTMRIGFAAAGTTLSACQGTTMASRNSEP
jgi:hypothetical protein